MESRLLAHALRPRATRGRVAAFTGMKFTAVAFIGEYAFYDCKRLRSVVVPASSTFPFEGCIPRWVVVERG